MKLSNVDGMNIIDRYDEDVDGHLFESDTGKLVYYYNYEVLKQQYEGVFQAFKNACNQRDQREAQNAELLAAARFGVSNLSAYGQDACDLVIRVLEKAIAKAGVK